MAEFRIVTTDTVFDNGKYRHSLFLIGDGDGKEAWRAVTFRELTYLPLQERDDPDLLGKQWLALRGLYNSGVDFTYTAMGVYQPQRVGVVQFYGAAAESWNRDEAIAEMDKRMLAVEAVLANYPQSKIVEPEAKRVQWLIDRLRTLPRILAILGHPDPRLARRGLGKDGSMGDADDELTDQQGENLLRGLTKIGEDFVFLVTAAHVGRQILAKHLVRMSRIASQYASRQRGNLGVGFSIAVPLIAALGSGYGGSHGGSRSHARSTSDAVAQGWGHSHAQAWSHQMAHGHTSADSHSAGGAVGGGVTTAQSHGHAVSSGYGDSASHTDSRAHGVSHVESQSQGTSHVDSHSHGVSHVENQGWGTSHTTSHGHSIAHSQGTTISDADTSGHSQGGVWSVSGQHTHGTNESSQISTNNVHSEGHSIGETSGGGATDAGSSATTLTQGTAHTESHANIYSGGVDVLGVGHAGYTRNNAHGDTTSGSSSMTTGTSHSTTQNGSLSQTDSWQDSSGMTIGGSRGSSRSDSVGISLGGSSGTFSSHTHGTAHSNSTTQGESWGTADAVSHSHGVADGRSESWGTADGRFQSHGSAHGRSESWGTADSHGHSTFHGQADSVGSSIAHSKSWNRSWASGHTEADSSSEGWGVSKGESVSEQRSRAHGWGAADGKSVAVGGGRTFAGSLSGGVIPGFSISRGWQTEDDLAQRLTEVTRGLESLLNQASIEGGFMTTALLFTSERGERAAESLVPQSFHGPNVPTPVLTVPGDDSLRINALAFRPSLEPDGDPFGAGLWTRWGTLLTPGMLAAYTAPNLFEEGTAVTVQKEIPETAFYPEMDGDVVVAHQISRETGDVTTVPLKLSQDRYFHTAFTGDTGYGKTVTAIRMVYETTLKWRMASVVLDFGAGWRQLLNAPGLDGRVEILQLSPGGVRPLRWNPLQIGRNFLPEFQWRAFADVFGNVAVISKKQQIHEMRDAIRGLYMKFGVTTDDDETLDDPAWGKVQADEESVAGAKAGTPLRSLPKSVRQAIAVHRSKRVGLKDLRDHIEELERPLRATDIRRGILASMRTRLDPLVQGAAAKQYGPGEDSVEITSIVPGDWGVAILEGGMFLDEFSKAFLLGWIAWHIFYDAVMRRLQAAKTPKYMQMVFEEANKILSGVVGEGEEFKGPATTTEQFARMWIDSRKYGIWLHVISQTPQQIPKGILSSCNNAFVGMLKDPRDRDIMTAHLGKSEKGFVGERWRTFLADIPKFQAVARLAYAEDRAYLEPVYVKPFYLEVPEPTDQEIAAKLGEIEL